jgi:hypothetical protein
MRKEDKPILTICKAIPTSHSTVVSDFGACSTKRVRPTAIRITIQDAIDMVVKLAGEGGFID